MMINRKEHTTDGCGAGRRTTGATHPHAANTPCGWILGIAPICPQPGWVRGQEASAVSASPCRLADVVPGRFPVSVQVAHDTRLSWSGKCAVITRDYPGILPGPACGDAAPAGIRARASAGVPADPQYPRGSAGFRSDPRAKKRRHHGAFILTPRRCGGACGKHCGRRNEPGAVQYQKWLRLFEQHSPNYKWSPGGWGRCRVVHGGGRRLRRTTGAVDNSGRTTRPFYAAS